MHFLSHYPDFLITTCSKHILHSWIGGVQVYCIMVIINFDMFSQLTMQSTTDYVWRNERHTALGDFIALIASSLVFILKHPVLVNKNKKGNIKILPKRKIEGAANYWIMVISY